MGAGSGKLILPGLEVKSGFRLGRNHDEPITVSDFRDGACRMGLGYIDTDIAQSAFNIYDHNRKGYLDRNDAICAYNYLNRLYS